MKKLILTILIFIFFAICNPNEILASSIVSIVDNSYTSEEAILQGTEYFYEDETYEYFFNAYISFYIIVTYDDGTQENIKEALENGNITIEDLNEYNILYEKVVRSELAEYNFDELFSYIGKDDTIDIKNIKIADPSIYNSELSVQWDLEYAKVIRHYIETLPEVKDFYKEKSNIEYAPIVYCNNASSCEISYKARKLEAYEDEEGNKYPGEEFRSERKIYNIELEITKDYDKELFRKIYEGEILGTDKSQEGIESLKNFYLYDLEFINSTYNYKDSKTNFLKKLYTTENAEIFIPELRELFEKHPELTFKSLESDAGEMSTNISYTKTGDYLILKDGIFYGYKPIAFVNSQIILISDKTVKTSQAYIAAAEKRIKDYINDSSINISIEELESFDSADSEELNNQFTDFLNEALNTNTTYSAAREENVNLYRLEIGTKQADIFIIPVPDDKLKEVEFKAKNNATGIIISSKSYDLPLDAMLTIKDVLNQMKDKQIISAFDITLYSQIKEAMVTNIKNGIKIFIPVTKDFKIDGKKIYYIDDNGKKKTEYKIELETIDGKQYISFVTNHLSTYALIDENIENPKTGVFSPLTSLFMLVVGGFILYWSTKTKENFEEL